MLNLWEITGPVLLTYLFIVVRLSGLFLTAPFFGAEVFSSQTKVLLGLLVGLAVFPAVTIIETLPEHPWLMAIEIAKELIVGLVIGYSCQIVFFAIQMAGSFIGQQMMFQMVNVLDPESDIQISIIGQIEFLVAILLFLAIDGHHWILKAVVDSFSLVPLGRVHLPMNAMLSRFDHLFGKLFVIAFQVAAPVAGTLFILHFVMGLIARIMPQMNVFIVGMPLYVGVGLLLVGVSFSFIFPVLERYFLSMIDDAYIFLRIMG